MVARSTKKSPKRPAAKPAAAHPVSQRVTALRKAFASLRPRGLVNLAAHAQEPDFAQTLAAGIAAGRIDLSACWSGWCGDRAWALDVLPVEFATMALEHAPFADPAQDEVTYLDASWYERAASLLARALRADHGALDGFAKRGHARGRTLVQIARVEAGIAPADTLAPKLRRALADAWLTDEHAPSLDASRGTRLPHDDAACCATAKRILGDDAVATLAASLAAQVTAKERDAVYAPTPTARDPLFTLAAPALSPETLGAFPGTYDDWCRWSEGRSVQALLAASRAACARRWAGGDAIAAITACRAIEGDPSVAPQLEPSLAFASFEASHVVPEAAWLRALRRAPPTWLRAFLSRAHEGPIADAVWRTGRLGLVLLATVDRDAAEARLRSAPALAEQVRVIYLGVDDLLDLLDLAGPSLQRMLLGCLLSLCGRVRGDIATRVDARLSLDPTALDPRAKHPDPALVRVLQRLPRERAAAVLRRGVEEGHRAHVVAVLEDLDDGDALRALVGA